MKVELKDLAKLCDQLDAEERIIARLEKDIAAGKYQGDQLVGAELQISESSQRAHALELRIRALTAWLNAYAEELKLKSGGMK